VQQQAKAAALQAIKPILAGFMEQAFLAYFIRSSVLTLASVA